MPQTFNQHVFIDGAADEKQLRVQGSAAQTEPLQTWENNAGDELVRITSAGKLQIGDLGISTPEAFIEAGADLTPSSPKPKRGLHALGRFTGAISSPLIWAVHELELLGSGGITSLQTALRARIRNDNNGDVTNAELRAGDFAAVNQKGGLANRINRLTGMRASAETSTAAYTARATGVEVLISNDVGGNVTDATAFEVVTPINSGTITNLYGLRVPDLTQAGNNYAIHTGQGIVHLGGHQELSVLGSSPTTNPPTNFIKLYVKLANGVPTLYAKDAAGVEYLVGGSGALSAPLILVGSTDVTQFTVRGASGQTQDLVRLETTGGIPVTQMRASGALYLWGKADDVRLLVQSSPSQSSDLMRVEKNDGTPIAQLTPNGGWHIWGQSDDVRLLAKASATQSQDMLRLEASNGAAMLTVSGTGATRIDGRANTTQLTIKGPASQTADLFQIQTSAGAILNSVSATGEVRINGAGDAAQLVVQESPNQTTVSDIQRWQSRFGTVVASLSAAGTLQVEGLRMPPGAASGRVLVSDASGSATWGSIPAPLQLVGADDLVQLYIKGHSTQTNDLFRIDRSNGTAIVQMPPSGAMRIWGQNDDVRLLVQGSATQTSDLMRLENNAGLPITQVTGSGALYLWGKTDNVRFLVQGSPIQTSDMLRLELNDGTPIAQVHPSGAMRIWGQTDDVRLLAKASVTQSQDMLRLEAPNGSAMVGVSGTGAMTINGTGDTAQLVVQESANQTAVTDIQRWQNRFGSPVASVAANGDLTVNKAIVASLRMDAGAAAGRLLVSDAAGNAAWGSVPAPLQLIGSDDSVQLYVKGHSSQTNDLLRLETSVGAPVAQVTANGALYLWGKSDDVRLFAQGSPTQTNDLMRIEKYDGTPVAQLSPNGGWRVWGQADDVRLLAKASAAQSQDMLRLESADGGALMAVSGTGATRIEGRADTTQFMVKGPATQTADLFQIQSNAGTVLNSVSATGEVRINGDGDAAQLVVQESYNQTTATDIQRWQNRFGTVVASIATNGNLITSKVIADGFKMAPNAGPGKVLTSDASGNATWANPSAGGVTSVGLAAPSIFTVANSPVTSTGTLTLSLSTQTANRFLAGPASGGAAAPTFRTLVAADLSTPLASPPAIGGTTAAAGTFTALNATTSVTSTVTDSGTSTTPSAGLFRHNSSATPAANFGVAASFQAESTTTDNRDQGRIRTMWIAATDASRAAKMVLTAYDTAEREGLAIQASGSASMIGFLGATPVVRQTGGVKTAAAAYGANEQSMLQIAYNALRTYGLLT